MPKIYTRAGDRGDTGLADGGRAGKDSAVIAALGDIDELGACLGVLRAEGLPADMDACLRRIQHDLFDIGAALAGAPGGDILAGRARGLERRIDEMERGLPPLKAFILPAGARPAALCQQARAVCRRAERAIVACSAEREAGIEIRRYINRLSDYLFVAARVLNKAAGREEELWRGKAKG